MLNSYRAMRQLLGDGAVLVGQVSNVSSSSLVVTLDSGAKISAKGSATLGQRVYVKNGYIQGLAPSMTSQVVEV